ncbi:MAG: hypothetical protein ACRYFU_16240 [Janthinobacterium lividum]
MLRLPRLVLAATILLISSGCNTPDAVSKFCGSANTTLAAAIPVFKDLPASCLREVNLQKGIGAFEAVQTDPSCDLIAKQAEGAVAATKILSDYFSALNSLATFGTAKVGSDASSLLSKTEAAVGAGSAAQTALGSMAGFLATAATGAYQQRALNKDLTVVSKNIGDVVDALVTIVQNNYIDQALTAENQKLGTRYKEFALTSTSAEVLLNLDDRWHVDERSVDAKRASAETLISALQAIKNGTADLAANAHSVKAKELPGLLNPYITQIQMLIPQIQKGF